MARIPYVEYDQATAETQQMYKKLENMNGQVVNIYKLLGNHPKALQGLMGLSLATYRSGELDPQLAELTYLYTSALNQCHY